MEMTLWLQTSNSKGKGTACSGQMPEDTGGPQGWQHPTGPRAGTELGGVPAARGRARGKELTGLGHLAQAREKPRPFTLTQQEREPYRHQQLEPPHQSGTHTASLLPRGRVQSTAPQLSE